MYMYMYMYFLSHFFLLPSPLPQDILVTQSEYVRCELGRLQEQLQQLEQRAVDIESDIRQSMSIGEGHLSLQRVQLSVSAMLSTPPPPSSLPLRLSLRLFLSPFLLLLSYRMYMVCICTLYYCSIRQQGGGREPDAGVVLSSEWQE